MVNLVQTTLCPKCKHMVKPIRKVGLKELLVGIFLPINKSYFHGEDAKSCPLCGYSDVYDEGLGLIKPSNSDQVADYALTSKEMGLVAAIKRWCKEKRMH
jgi:hypothetical protein